ncbi:hypothetical protein KIL84_009575 [Mauremys mutica]|uniref:Uncharacterized protein n=1 Tax=Mauremys mutica TaxID=74926 RepID=A0A9D3XLS3_9SAUR|nr:hypothetical protein KIL84_009575 [Mauremys mutica]
MVRGSHRRWEWRRGRAPLAKALRSRPLRPSPRRGASPGGEPGALPGPEIRSARPRTGYPEPRRNSRKFHPSNLGNAEKINDLSRLDKFFVLHQQIRPQNDPKAEFRLRVIAREDRENMPGNHLSQVMQFAEKLGVGKRRAGFASWEEHARKC